jgi:hypothetical protein
MSGLPDGWRGRVPVVAGVALVALGFLTALLVPGGGDTAAPVALAAPNVFTGPVNGGCYLRAPTECAIHVDSWQPITVDPGLRIDAFRLGAARAGGGFKNLYDFRMDVSNPPGNTYRPSLPRRDFAAACGITYQARLMVSVVGDDALTEAGRPHRRQRPRRQRRARRRQRPPPRARRGRRRPARCLRPTRRPRRRRAHGW